MPSSFLLRSMTSASFALPILARCERPTAAFFRASRLHPGCLAHGPEEKQGFFGVCVGFMVRNFDDTEHGWIAGFFAVPGDVSSPTASRRNPPPASQLALSPVPASGPVDPARR